MREVLRICHGGQSYDGRVLRDYNLTVYAGEIVFIQGLSGSGILSLGEFLKGRARLSTGDMYIEEEKPEEWSEEIAQHNGIYVINGEEELLDNLTIAENLELFRGRHPFQYFHKEKTEEAIRLYLEAQHFKISPHTKVERLSSLEKQELGLIKARLLGAKVIVLDCAKGAFEQQNTEELCRMMKRMKREKISFIILAERLNAFAEIATKMQVIKNGRDLMEWDTVDFSALNQRLTQEKDIAGELLFDGIYDEYWDAGRTFFDYFEAVKENHPNDPRVQSFLFPENKNNAYYLEKAGIVLIPKDSALRLHQNMEIRETIALSIPTRTGFGKFGYIQKPLVNYIAEDFYRQFQVDPGIRYVHQLTFLEKKLLSVFRWAQAKPSCIYLDNPYYGLDPIDEERLREYLAVLARQGIRIVYSAKSSEEMKRHCRTILMTENARNAHFIEAETEGG